MAKTEHVLVKAKHHEKPRPQSAAIGLTVNWKCELCTATGKGNEDWVVVKPEYKRCSETGISGIHVWKVKDRTGYNPGDDVMPKLGDFSRYGGQNERPGGDWRGLR